MISSQNKLRYWINKILSLALLSKLSKSLCVVLLSTLVFLAPNLSYAASPENEALNRAEISKPLLLAIYGSDYIPAVATGEIYTDVQPGDFNADWIEKLEADDITEGCAANLFCPEMVVTKEQLAKIILKAKHGSTYLPPIASGSLFTDVSSGSFAANWIEALANEGIADGCDANNFCPNEAVTVEGFEKMRSNVFPIVALLKIMAYAEDGNNPEPTLQDYINAGVSGVSSKNLAQLNALVDGLLLDDVDTIAELVALTTQLNPLEQPQNVQVVAGDQQVILSWDPVGDPTAYDVCKATETITDLINLACSSYQDGEVLVDSTNPAVITALTNGTEYFFVVTPRNTNGDGVPSAEVSATPTATSTSPINSANIFTNERYDSSELSVDPATGQSIVRTRLSILFKATATPEQVNALLTRINATVTAAIAGARSMGIRIPDPVTVDALDAIIADIKSEVFVEAVMKAVHIQPTALPDNIIETITSDLAIIDNQLAIGGPAAWNAKEAIVIAPNVIIIDFWGNGETQLNSFLDATLAGFVFSGVPNPSDHGYHVAGILNGSYGGGSSTAALVTGIFPGHANLHTIDLSYPVTGFDAEVRAIMMAAPIGGTVIMSTSIGWPFCDNTTTTGSCTDIAYAMEEAITWINMVRAAGMETKIFHATAAGNRAAPRYEARDTETQYSYSAAATMTNIATIDGVQVPTLTNTVVVENLSGTGHPRRVECLDENSFIGGNISSIGTDVTSLSYTGTVSKSGTSMATPQVAGLAAYLLAIDPSLSPQKIKEILLNTAQAVPTAGGVNCSDAIAAPAIDAYAAVLALDKSSALNGNRSNAPVRNAILDISSNGMHIDNDGNGQFDEYDLMYFIQELEIGNQEKKLGTATVKYSRADLNGDGFDGGSDGYKRKFNLDIDYPPTFTLATQNIEGELWEFDEASLSDDEILCYYAYSSLYTGSTVMRTNLLANRCQGPSTIAIYYEHTNQVTFPSGFIASCSYTDDDASDQRSNYSTRPGNNPFDPVPERPSSQFWQPGDFNADQVVLNENSIRRSYDPGGEFNNCDIQVNYRSVSEVDSTIELSQTGDTVNVDLSATSTSECWETHPGSERSCSGAQTVSQFNVDYDFEISAATSLNLILNFSCTGPGLRFPDDTTSFLGSEVGFSITRLNAAGERIPTNWGSGNIVVPLPIACYDDSPTVNIQQLITFNPPETPGDVERIIISASGKVGAFGNFDHLTLGELTNTSTMQGTVQLLPAN